MKRDFTRQEFDKVYDERILPGGFQEVDRYYRVYKGRYRRTLEFLKEIDLPNGADVLEFGGGQMALLCQGLFGDRCTLADLSHDCEPTVRKHGVDFIECDLLHDQLPPDRQYDLVIMCEVVEHLMKPVHLVLPKVIERIRPGGYMLVTTPNFYRLRNMVRMMSGREIICPWRIPPRGDWIGHVLEFSEEHLKWQLQQSGLTDVRTWLAQLTFAGFTAKTSLLRALTTPLLMRRLWREAVVAIGRKPA